MNRRQFFLMSLLGPLGWKYDKRRAAITSRSETDLRLIAVEPPEEWLSSHWGGASGNLREQLKGIDAKLKRITGSGLSR